MNEREVFEAALGIADPSARQAYLDQACAGNPQLRQQVEHLLVLHATAGDFLSTPAVQQMSSKTTAIDGKNAPGSSEFEKTHGYSQEAAQGDGAINLEFLSPSDKPGSLGKLAHYEVHEVLGQGAFGIVLKAFDEKLHRMVAIKVLSPELAKASPPRKRFLREARASAAIRHEHVVTIHVVEEQPIPYLVMEYIPGITLERALYEHGPLDVPDVLRLGQQIAAGLAAAHAQGLIHRDIKPSNILLENGLNGKVKITDFGLARAADDASLTTSGVIAGTPMYMSPEQATTGDLDQRSDLFSLGSVLYVMISGRPPFRAANTLAVLKRVVEESPRPIHTIIADVPSWLCAIIGKLHAKQPDDRFATAQDVADLLGKCLADLQANRPVVLPVDIVPVETPPPKPAVSDGGIPAMPSPAFASTRQHSRTSARRAWPTIAAAALILLAGLGITEATGVTQLTSTVIRLTTGSGTLVIETDDPSVKVTIDGEEVSIQGAGVEQLTLKPGQYKVAAVKNGEAVSQQLVTITRGGKQVVRVTMEGIATTSTVSLDPTGRAISADAPDRRAAEYVLSIGGTIKIRENDEEREIKAAGELPIGKFDLTFVDVYKNSKVDDSGLSSFRGCTQLEHLNIAATNTTDVGLANFQDCKRLQFLKLYATKATDVGVAYFKDCHDLRHLSLVALPISDASLANFSKCHELLTLELGLTPVSDDGLKHFRDCKKLMTLDLEGTFNWTDAGLEVFRDCRNLQFLNFTRSALTDSGLEYFQNCMELAELQLPLTRVTDVGLAHLKNCKELKLIKLGATQVTDAGVANFRDCQSLGYISLDQTEVTDASLVYMKGWPKLRMIGLSYTSVSDAGLLELARHPGLGCSLAYTRVSLSGIEQLQAARPELRFDAGSWPEVNRMVAEAVLSLGGKVEIGVPGKAESRPVASVDEFPREYFQVRRISLAGVEKPLEKLPELLTLLKYPKFDRLESVDLSGITGLTYEFLPPIAGLEELKLANTGLTDITLVKLPKLPTLKRLVLDGNDLKGPGLASLKEQPALIDVSLKQTKVTAAKIDELKLALPKCRIEWDGGVIEPRESSDGWHGWPADAPSPAIAPFDAEQAKKHQEAWAKYLGVPVEYTNSIGMKFRLIPPGEFLMGSTAEEIEEALSSAGADEVWQERINSEAPQHKVVLTQPIYLGIHEVTQGQYEQATGKNPSIFATSGTNPEGVAKVADLDTSTHPVETVRFFDAIDFCVKLSEQEKLKPFYFRTGETITPLNGTGYRMPSEAEWEFACRAGTTTKYWIGDRDDDLIQAGWFRTNSDGRTHAVGDLKANPFGLFDIHGNVWEWVQDVWEPTFYNQFQEQSAINPNSSSSTDLRRVLRGGSWFNPASFNRASFRVHFSPTYHDDAVGVRVSLPIDAVKQALKLPKPEKPADPPATSDATKPQPAELVLPHLNGQPYPTRTAATWEPGPKENTIPGLIPRAAKLDGVARWQIESIAPRGKVGPIAMSPNHKYVACVLESQSTQALPCTVRLYDTETGELVHLLPHPAGVGSISWHNDSRQFATGSVDGKVRVWTVAGKRGAEWQAHKDHVHVAWSPDGEWIATHRDAWQNTGDASVKLWRESGTAGAVHVIEAAGIERLAWSADGRQLAVTSNLSPKGNVDEGRLHFIQMQDDNRKSFTLEECPNIKQFAWHPDGQRFAVLARKEAQAPLRPKCVLRLMNGKEMKLTDIEIDLPGFHRIDKHDLTWSPDGKYVAAALANACGLWNADGTPVTALRETNGIVKDGYSNNAIYSLRWSSDSKFVFFGDGRLFQADGTPASQGWSAEINSLAGWSDDSQKIISVYSSHGLVSSQLDGPKPAGLDRTQWHQPAPTASWHARSPAFVAGPNNGFRWWTLDGRPGPVMVSGADFSLLFSVLGGIRCSPEGSKILTAYGNFAAFRDRHRLIRYQRFPALLPDRLSWSPDGKHLALGSNEGASIVTVDSPEVVVLGDSPREISDVEWSPDGEWIATAEGNKVCLWKPDGTPGNVLEFPSKIWVVKWHPNSRELAVEPTSGNAAFEVRHIDGTPKISLRSPLLSGVLRSDWSRDGQLFVTGTHGDGYTGTHLVAWNMDEGEAAWNAALKPHHNRELRKLEWGADDQHLLTQAAEGTFGVWNGRTGELQWLIACPTDQDSFSFDAAGQLLHGDPTKLDAWFRCVTEEPDGTSTAIKPSEFAQRFPEFVTPGSWPEDGKPTDPERKAASRLLDIGCELGVYVGGVGRMVKSVNDLPRERFSIVMITGPLTDGDLVWLHKNRETFAELFMVELTSGSNTDQGLKLFKDFADLWTLVVVTSQKIGPGLEIPQLTCVGLHGEKIGVEALGHLKALPELMELDLTGPWASDDMIEPLVQLKNLRALNVRGTKITPDGIARLKAALPLCDVKGP